jgi:hypothetical protein
MGRKAEMYRINLAAFLSLAALVSLSGTTAAAVPAFVTYSGRLTDGTAWSQSATLALTFTLYDAATDGNALWTQTFPEVAVADGYFSVVLGEGTDPANSDAPRVITDVFAARDGTWIGVSLDGGLNELTRQPIGSVPYAAQARRATWPGVVPLGSALGCVLQVSGNTLVVKGQDEDGGVVDLSPERPCLIGVRHPEGRGVTVAFTQDVAVTFGPDSDTDGNLFGVDTHWPHYLPVFVAVIHDGVKAYLTISRLPLDQPLSPVCFRGQTTCDAEGSVMLLVDGLAPEGWSGRPMTQVGWVLATFSASGEAWTFSTSPSTGFNQTYERQTFMMPPSQNGAASGKFFLDNGGKAPRYDPNTSVYQYYVTREGIARIQVEFKNPIEPGVGDVALYLATPYKPAATYSRGIGNFLFVQAPTNGIYHGVSHGIQGIFFENYTYTQKKNADIVSTADIYGMFEYSVNLQQ